MTERLRYRLLSGPDDLAFCERVSAVLDVAIDVVGEEVAEEVRGLEALFIAG